MSRTRLIIAVLSGLCTVVLLPIATNIATSALPEWLRQYSWLAWPAIVVLSSITIWLVILTVKFDRSPGEIADLARAKRKPMLAKVRHDWIDNYLKHSLHELVRIALGLEDKPDAVSWPWDLIVQQPDRAPRLLPPGQPISTAFDDLGQALLILGAPGAGKTTMLLELARDLLNRADKCSRSNAVILRNICCGIMRCR